MNAEYWITKLQLEKHPEGGYFKETYRSDESIPLSGLPSRFQADRAFCTAILFLLRTNEFSAFHRIKSDELWHFYSGNTLSVYVIHSDGTLETILLGPNPDKGEVFQAVVPAGTWFASKVNNDAVTNAFALVGCTVSPGFDFADFEMADRKKLCAKFSMHEKLISSLTY